MADRSLPNSLDAELVGRLLRLLEAQRDRCAAEDLAESNIAGAIQAISEELAGENQSADSEASPPAPSSESTPSVDRLDDVAKLERELFQRQQELADKIAQTRIQRRTIAQEFKRRRHELLAELESRQSELAAQEEQLRSLRRQLDERCEALEEREQQLLERDDGFLGGGSAAAGPAGSARETELDEELGELRQRYEMALADVRELKSRNADLEEQLSRRQRETTTIADAGSANFDWESQKRRMLASLEGNFDDDDRDDHGDREERLTVEGTIRITDGVIAQKDAQIAELKEQLARTSSEASAPSQPSEEQLEALFDADEIIAQERQRLVILQEQWREKLKKSEVELSLERAKLGRERTQLEERLQNFEAEKAKLSLDSGDDHGGTKGGKSKGRRWWSRLGLKDEE